VDALHFVYSLDVRAATGPAGELSRALTTLNGKLGATAKALASIEASPGAAMGKVARASEAAAASVGKFAAASQRAAGTSSASGRRIADEWQRMAERAEKAEQRKTAAMEREGAKQAAAAERMTSRRAAIEERAAQKRTAAMERESARQQAQDKRDEDRTARKVERMAQRIERVNKQAESQSLRRQYGGAQSFRELLTNTAESRAGGIRSSIASGIIGGPSALAMGAVSAVGSGVSWVAEAAYGFGKMAVNAQAMRESSVEGFKAIYGTAEIGNELFEAARVAAKKTKFDTADVVRDYNTIAAAGFRADQIQRIYWTSADIGSARGTGKQQQYLTALAKINASPQAAFGAVQQAALAGPGIGNVFDELGSRLGLKQTLTRKGWMQKFRSGEISGSVALESVIGATNKLYNKGTGEAGEYARGQGDKSWSGVLSNIKNGLGDVLNMQLPEGHAINKLKKILQSIGSTGGVFDENSPTGARFKKLVSATMEDVFIPFGGLEQNAGTLIEKMLAAGEQIEKKFRSVMEQIRDGINEAFAGGDATTTLEEFAVKIGVAVGKGIWIGIKEMAAGAGKVAISAIEGDLVGPGGWLSGAQDLVDKYGPESWGRGGNWQNPFKETPVGEFASGGVIPGPYGSPQLAIMHGGEVVPGLQGEYMGAAQAAYGGGGGGTTNVFNFHGYNIDELEQAVGRVLTMSVRSPSAATTP